MKRPTRYSRKANHVSFGIQNWLKSKGFCLNGKELDKETYKNTLRAFYESETGSAKFLGTDTPEGFADSNFPKFCTFCIKRFATPTKPLS